MPGPTLELLYDDEGALWQVTYAGMTKHHRQEWQAWWYYEWAKALYLVNREPDRSEGENR